MKLPQYQQVAEQLARKQLSCQELVAGDRRVLVVPELNGDVITATAGGAAGTAFGWMNPAFYADGYDDRVFRNPGALNRWWVGPEGGRWSFFHSPHREQKLERWRVPRAINRGAMEVRETRGSQLVMQGSYSLDNWQRTPFSIWVQRTVELLDNDGTWGILGLDPRVHGASVVGLRTHDCIANTGEKTWSNQTGLISLWVLSQFPQGERGVILLPFKTGNPKQLGPMPKTDFFGPLSAEQCVVDERGCVFLRSCSSAGFCGQIGVCPERATGWQAALQHYGDPSQDLLFVVHAELCSGLGRMNYLSNVWDPAADPREGEAEYCYTDTGSALGGYGYFGELETVSPAKQSDPCKSPEARNLHAHVHTIFVMQRGDSGNLEEIAAALFGIDPQKIPYWS